MHISIPREIPNLPGVTVLRISVQGFLVVSLDVSAVTRSAASETADQTHPQVCGGGCSHVRT